MIGLTRRQSELLEFVSAHVKAHGIGPSRKEMAKALGIRSRGYVNRLVDMLVERGRVRIMPGRARAIEIVESKDHHASNCDCGVCVSARYHAQLKFVHALKVAPPVALLKARADNFRPLSAFKRAALLGQPARDIRPSKVC